MCIYVALKAISISQATDGVAAAFTAFDRVEILSESLPYLQMFRGKTIVVKYGGAAMKNPSLMVTINFSRVLGCFCFSKMSYFRDISDISCL